MSTKIQIRRDTAANWFAENPILAQGEFGLETDTMQLKFGNGTTLWNDLSYFQGMEGDDGESAYEIWIGLGNTGTEQDFIDSLKGADGAQGVPGEKGDKGDTGEQGAQGIQGIQGETGAQGTAGADGIDGEDGLSAYEVWLELGNSGTNQDFIDSLQGEQGIQGIQGEKGDTGDTGAQGIQGEQGLQGIQGEQGNPGPNQVTTDTATNITGFLFGNGSSVIQGGSINSQTDSYTLQLSDNGKVIPVNSATAVTITIPDSLPAEFSCSIIQTGAGQVTFAGSGSMAINHPDNHTKTRKQKSWVSLYVESTNNVYLGGDTAE